MEKFLHYLVSNIVNHPDEIEITQELTGNQLTYFLKVNSEDMGQIIGKHGKIIASLRHLIKLKNQITPEQENVTLQLIDQAAQS